MTEQRLSRDERITAATLHLLRTKGPAAVTVEAVAARSGVAKTTIYRRYRNRNDMLTAALASITSPPTPSNPSELLPVVEWLVEQSYRAVHDGIGAGGLAALLTDENRDYTPVLRSIVDQHRAALASVIGDAMNSNVVRGDIDLETAMDCVAGAYLAELARSGGVAPGWIKRVLRTMLPALSPRGDSLAVLATQQSALRRVATLVARGGGQSEVLSAVAEEMARCLNMNNAEVMRYADDGMAVVVASYTEPGEPSFPVGKRVSLEGDNVATMVLQTGRAARKDTYEHAAGSLAARAREMGIQSVVGAPIVVDERLWGAALVRSPRPEPLPPDTEEHVAEFAYLTATAIAAAATRAELIESRGRIVAAADQTRRRLERNLHDGAQQRVVSLGLQLRMAQDLVPPELGELKGQLSRIESGFGGLLEELREISHGLHPAILSRGGLGPAIEALARRETIPVTLDVEVDRRLPETVEVAAYYVVAEAFTNAAKHAQASELTVTLTVDDENLHLLVRDDGVGGADFSKGSGLIGLKDRVEALGGQLDISSPAGNGTALRATVPLHRP